MSLEINSRNELHIDRRVYIGVAFRRCYIGALIRIFIDRKKHELEHSLILKVSHCPVFYGVYTTLATAKLSASCVSNSAGGKLLAVAWLYYASRI